MHAPDMHGSNKLEVSRTGWGMAGSSFRLSSPPLPSSFSSKVLAWPAVPSAYNWRDWKSCELRYNFSFSHIIQLSVHKCLQNLYNASHTSPHRCWAYCSPGDFHPWGVASQHQAGSLGSSRTSSTIIFDSPAWSRYIRRSAARSFLGHWLLPIHAPHEHVHLSVLLPPVVKISRTPSCCHH